VQEAGHEVGEEAVASVGEDRVVTIPNVVSLGRLLCVAVFLVLLFRHPVHRLAATYLLGVLGATDWVDGYAARHLHQVSNLGKVLDPVADRVLLGVAVVAILLDGAVPGWVAGLAIVREAVVAAAAVALATLGVRRIDVQWAGKAGTFALMFAFPFFLAGHAPDLSWHHAARLVGWGFVVPGLLFRWYAAVTYVPLARGALLERRVESTP